MLALKLLKLCFSRGQLLLKPLVFLLQIGEKPSAELRILERLQRRAKQLDVSLSKLRQCFSGKPKEFCLVFGAGLAFRGIMLDEWGK